MFQNTDDSEIWTYALENNLTVGTKDEDFPHRQMQSQIAPAIVWVRIGNTSRKALLAWFQPLLPIIEFHLNQGDKLIEIR